MDTAQTTTQKPGLGSVGDFIRNVWKVYTEHLSDLLVLGLLTTLPNILFALVAGLATQSPEKSALLFSNIPIPGSIALFGVAFLLLIFWPVYVEIAMYRFLANNGGGIAKAFRGITGKLYGRVWGASLLVGLYVLGGLILLIVPGIYFSLVFFFVPAVVILQNLSVSKSLSESRRLTKGMLGDIFWKYFVLGLVIVGISIVANIVLTIALSALSSSSTAGADIASSVTSLAVNAITTPLPMIGILLLYQKLVHIKGPAAQ